MACTAFWLLDATGPTQIAFVLAIFFSGMTVPLVIFPGWLKDVALALPWAAYLQIPADIWLGKRSGLALVEALGLQALWAASCSASARRCSASRPARSWSRVAEVLSSAAVGYRDIASDVDAGLAGLPGVVLDDGGQRLRRDRLDFLGIWIMFTTVDSLGGFDLAEIAFLYGATGLGLGFADLLVGRIERLGQMIRMGRLDAMMVRPIPLLAQVCADEFALRRVARVVQTGLILIGGWYVDWSLPKAGLAAAMVVSGSVIFFALFIGFACLQFWTSDASEVANAFTYGGNTVTQYPLTIFPREVVTGLTFLIPLAFVNWYPALYILDRSDPFGFPAWLQFASPLAALCSGRWRCSSGAPGCATIPRPGADVVSTGSTDAAGDGRTRRPGRSSRSATSSARSRCAGGPAGSRGNASRSARSGT